MKNIFKLSQSLTHVSLMAIAFSTVGLVNAMEGSKSTKGSRESFANQLKAKYETLKDDWKCLFDRKRKCTWQQKARITTELTALAVLIGRGYLDWQRRAAEERVRRAAKARAETEEAERRRKEEERQRLEEREKHEGEARAQREREREEEAKKAREEREKEQAKLLATAKEKEQRTAAKEAKQYEITWAELRVTSTFSNYTDAHKRESNAQNAYNQAVKTNDPDVEKKLQAWEEAKNATKTALKKYNDARVSLDILTGKQ